MSGTKLFNLTGKVSLITGGSSGLGRAFCEAMAECGSDVAFTFLTNEDGARETEEIIAKHGVKTLALKADVSKPQDVKELFRKVDQKFGKLDILFNNAGITTKLAKIHEMSLDDWNKVISADLTSVFMCMQEGIKLMLRQKSGSIINVASIFGLQGAFPGVFFNSNYCAAKAGVIGLTKQGASEYGRDGIRVNVIVPGFHTGTRLARPQFGTQTEEEAKDTEEKLKSITPMGRVATADELKGMAIYLASDASGFVTGASFIEDGGWSCW